MQYSACRDSGKRSIILDGKSYLFTSQVKIKKVHTVMCQWLVVLQS